MKTGQSKHKNYINKLYKIRKDIEIVGQYKNSRTKIEVRCLKCDNKEVWKKFPRELLRTKNCPHKIMNHDKYLKLVKKFNKNIIVLSKYINARTKIKHKCSDCNCFKGFWRSLPQNIISYKINCPNRRSNRMWSKTDKKLRIIALKFGMKQKEKYKGKNVKIKYECLKCGHIDFRSPRSILNRKNTDAKAPSCFVCRNNYKIQYSLSAIEWLENIAQRENIYIQHALNDGEYCIPFTRYKADGFCKSNNTIYEFYGDKFHGNIEIYKFKEKCNPFSNKTTAQLYLKTLLREKEIKDLGYNFVRIWENDYKRMLHL